MDNSKVPISCLSLNLLCLALLIIVQCNTTDSEVPQPGDFLSNVCGSWQITNPNCVFDQASVFPTYSNGNMNFDSLGVIFFQETILYLTKSTQGTTWTGYSDILNVTIDMSDSQTTFISTISDNGNGNGYNCSYTYQGNPSLISGTWVRDSNINSSLPETYAITVINNTYMMVNDGSNVSSYLVSISWNGCLNSNMSSNCDWTCTYYDSKLQNFMYYYPAIQMLQLEVGSILYYPQNRSTYQLIFPLGTWGNAQYGDSTFNCCIPNSMEISASTEPASQNELIVKYYFTPNVSGSLTCSLISGSMVDNVLTSSLTYSDANSDWSDTQGFYSFSMCYRYSDSSDSDGSCIDNGTIVSAYIGDYWPTTNHCPFSMTLQDGPSPNPNSELHLANWKFIGIIYGIFICYVIFN